MTAEPNARPRLFRVVYFLDDAEVLALAAPVTEGLAEKLAHIRVEDRVFEYVAAVFHDEAATVPNRATLVRWFGRIERKDPHERSTG